MLSLWQRRLVDIFHPHHSRVRLLSIFKQAFVCHACGYKLESRLK